VQVSDLMPYTWFVRLPGLASFREPSRITELGLVPAALLAGYAVDWLRAHLAPLVIAVCALALLEAGMSVAPAPTMPDALPQLDAPIAADPSHSIVVDVPFGIRGGVGITGLPFSPESLVLATADGHPRAEAYLSRIPPVTATAIGAEPFYRDLISTQTGHYQFTPAAFRLAAQNARTMKIGWVLLWTPNLRLENYLVTTGFRLDYTADGVLVYRPADDVPLTQTAISG
jgi:hypothetical protein